VRGDASLQRGPVRETILPGDNELRVAELDRDAGDSILWNILEFRVALENARKGFAFAFSALVEKFAGLALWNIEMGPLRQSP
jgi:hypothetical protein